MHIKHKSSIIATVFMAMVVFTAFACGGGKHTKSGAVDLKGDYVGSATEDITFLDGTTANYAGNVEVSVSQTDLAGLVWGILATSDGSVLKVSNKAVASLFGTGTAPYYTMDATGSFDGSTLTMHIVYDLFADVGQEMGKEIVDYKVTGMALTGFSEATGNAATSAEGIDGFSPIDSPEDLRRSLLYDYTRYSPSAQ